jgi:ABC-type phosphate transport system substrate-binding protein
MNINFRKSLPLLLSLSSLIYSGAAVADIAIIANPEFAADSATADDVKRLFLGKATGVSGVNATPVDHKSGGEEWAQFYGTVVGKSAGQLRAYWSRLIFTGKGKPPKALGNDEEVVSAVAGDASLIGYVDVDAVTGDVKILLTVP